jgi:predicted permease
VARAVLAESLVLAVAGGALGVLLAQAGVAAFLRFVPPDMPRVAEVALNARVLAILAVGSLCIGIAAGLTPALRQSTHDLASHSRGSGATQSRGGLRLRMSLVASQIALAAVLGVGATLLFRSFVNVATADPGFRAEGLTSFTAFTKRPGPQPAATWQVWDELLDDVRAVPGVDVAAASNLPFQSPDWAPAIQLEGDPPTSRRPAGAGYVVSPGFFDVMGMRIVEGRAFSQRDDAAAPRVVIANRAFAREHFPNGNAIGERIRVWDDEGALAEREIVGVVDNTVQARVEDGVLPALWFPYAQVEWPQLRIVVRSDRDAASLAADLRTASRRFNPITPAPAIERITDRMRTARTAPRFHAMLFVAFSSVAVLLAAIGLYGTLAHSVGRRSRELGIRMAVGADRSRIFALVMRQGLGVVAAGLAIGLAGAAVVTRFLRSYMFGVGTLDAATFAMTALLLTAVGAIAIARPARRATGIDPARSLREQ